MTQVSALVLPQQSKKQKNNWQKRLHSIALVTLCIMVSNATGWQKWDLRALAFHNGDMATTTALMWAFSTVGGAIGVAMWNLHYAADLLINRVSTAGAEEGNSKKVAMANSVLGNLCGFVFRFIPAMVILMTTAVVGSQAGVDISTLLPGWLLNTISIFGGIMAALGMGILLSFLMKKSWHFCIFLIGYCLVAYLGLSTMAVSVLGICVAVVLYEVLSRKEAK